MNTTSIITSMNTLAAFGAGKPPIPPPNACSAHPFPLRGGPSTDLCHGAWLSHVGPQAVQHWSQLLDRTGAQKISALLAMPGSVRTNDYTASVEEFKVSRLAARTRTKFCTHAIRSTS